jgi:predicted ATPase
MTLGEQFCWQLVDAMPTPQARLACLSVLAKWSKSTIYISGEAKAARRIRAAKHMLDTMPGDAIASELRERFNVSARTAWRDVKTARQTSTSDGTS